MLIGDLSIMSNAGPSQGRDTHLGMMTMAEVGEGGGVTVAANHLSRSTRKNLDRLHCESACIINSYAPVEINNNSAHFPDVYVYCINF